LRNPELNELEPGTRIVLDGRPAEVVRAYRMGELPFLRVYLEDQGLKTVCARHVEIEVRKDPTDHLGDAGAQESAGRWSPDWFDLRARRAFDTAFLHGSVSQ